MDKIASLCPLPPPRGGPFQELRFQRRVAEGSPSCSRVADSGFSFHNPEPLPRGIRITTDHHYRSRSHVLLFANDLMHAFVQVVSECVLRVFKQPPRLLVSQGDIVGGRYMSHFGFEANRLMTSKAVMAFSSRIVMVRFRRVPAIGPAGFMLVD